MLASVSLALLCLRQHYGHTVEQQAWKLRVAKEFGWCGLAQYPAQSGIDEQKFGMASEWQRLKGPPLGGPSVESDPDSGTLNCGNLAMGIVDGSLLARRALTQICQC